MSSVTYSVVVPLWEAPDELAHFSYVAHLVKNRSLPRQQSGVTDASHHPPLYYIVAALVSSVADYSNPTGSFRSNPQFVWGQGDGHDPNAALHHTDETFPYRGVALAAHLARGVSVAAGAATVVCTYAIARRLAGQSSTLGLLAATFVAFNPQFLFISGSINPDSMVAMISTIALWQLLRTFERPMRWEGWALTGLLCGFAVLTKSSAVIITAMTGLMLILSAYLHRSWRMLWQGVPAFGAAFVVISGWWFARNWILYGDPLGWQVFLSNWTAVRRYGPVTWPTVREFVSVQFRSYWATFGWMTIPAPGWYYRAVQIACGMSLLGWMRGLRQGCREGIPHFGMREPLSLIALVVYPLLQEAFQFRSIFMFDGSWYQGRYLFPAIAAISTLLALGLRNLIPNRAMSIATGVLAVGLMTSAIFMPLKVIHPVYAGPTLAKWQVWTLPHRTDIAFGDRVRLLGYRVRRSKSCDVRSATLTLYWQAIQGLDLDYSAFIHLVDGSGGLVVQSDIGLGSEYRYPTSAWQQGDIVFSRHTLLLPAFLPPDGEIRIGVYFWANGERLPAVVNGTFAGSYAALDPPTLDLPSN